jgi:peptidoglycan hydrolase-like protein with peptidoglycan-binding domain
MIPRILKVLVLVVLSCTSSSLYAATSTSTKSGKYDIHIPVLFGVSRADITPDFGDPRGGGTRTHEGQDIMAAEGTPIVSPVKGTVTGFGTAANPGKYVYVKGSDGHTYAFMHLDEIAKLKRGQKLKVGDLIGTVGETGNAKGTTPHLHFEIRKGKPLDPYLRLTKEFTLEEKIKYLNGALSDLKKSDDLVDFVVERYSGTLLLAQASDIELHKKFVTALKKLNNTSIGSTTLGLRVGAESEQVRVLQVALIKADMGPEARRLGVAGATGYFGAMTERALLEYQKAFGIPQDGVFTLATRNALAQKIMGEVKGMGTTTASVVPGGASLIGRDLVYGEESLEVKLLQALLIRERVGEASKILSEEGATGYFGMLTERALREYQKSKGLSDSGIFDAATQKVMSLST